MELTKKQIEFYNSNGYLIIEECFKGGEIQQLREAIPQAIESQSPRVIMENNGEIRSIFAPHFSSDVYSKLARHPKLVRPAEQLLSDKIYLHQYKINSKKGLKGDWWEWHQDFPYWHLDDGIPNPDMVSVMIYLQDVDYTNGPLLVIPGSHKLGIVKFADKDFSDTENIEKFNQHTETEFLTSLTSNIKFTVHENFIRETALANGIVSTVGRQGTVLFFHGNIFHASNVNLSPVDRDVVIITYNSINNLPQRIENPRPEYLAGKDYRPLIAEETGLFY